jgi:bifunctional non-homologous end joining protein LigD
MPSPVEREIVTVGGHEVAISNPDKVLFPGPGYTKRDLVRYYLSVAAGALRGAGGRPNVLVRYPNGLGGEFFYQKRAPSSRPSWIEVVALQFPSGRSAEEVVPRDAAALAWMANLACLELHPHPVRAEDLDHPDELRIDLDPVPGVGWSQLREVAHVVRATLDDVSLHGWPKTSGSRGIHIYVRIERRWGFEEVRRAALALAREVERRAPSLATSKWWKEERHGVFLDYNQNAKDRTVAAAYSVRPTPDARVSAPLSWSEIENAEPGDFTLATMPARFAAVGDVHAPMEARPCRLDALLELSARHEREGLGDAPWPPHYQKQMGEPPRVQPSRRRAPGPRAAGVKTARAQSASQETTRQKTSSQERSSQETPPQHPPPQEALQQETLQQGTPTRQTRNRRTPRRPLIEIARARKREEAQAGLERWKARHPAAAAYLQLADVLVDAMRGRFSTWTRIRLNLEHVPADIRPAQEALDPDDTPDDWSGVSREMGRRRRPSGARTAS